MRGIFAESMTVGEAISWGASLLDESEHGGRQTRQDATLLLRHVLGLSMAQVLTERERPLTREQTEMFNAAIRARAQGKPIQYITGQQEFFGLPFRVTPDVLIPRPETEHLVESAIERLRAIEAPRIADVGTGSGCIAIALAHALPQAEITALDVSPAALEIAKENSRMNGVADRIRFCESDLLSAVMPEKFDAVVSNPPYIALSEKKGLPIEVRDFEPAQALFAGKTGMEIYERLIPQAQNALAPGGWLLLEIGHGQRDAIAKLLHDWKDVEFINDLQGIPRVAVGQKA
jgi:release factor glutamine methyltransferase